jgi:hypothetical protein
MSLLCVWRQRKLAEVAAQRETLTANPGLREHLKQCASCRRFWEDLRNLTGELSALEEPLPAGDRFADAVWDRLTTPVARTRRVSVWLPVTAVAACALVGVVVWRIYPFRQHEKMIMQTTVPANQIPVNQHIAKPSVPVQPTPEKRLQTVSTKRSPSPSEGSGVRSTSSHRIGKRNRGEGHQKRIALRRYWLVQKRYAERKKRVREQEKQKRVATVNRPPTPEQWKAWGAYYEAQGDYQRASAAYGQAYAARPDTETGLAAGQAAESAGDVAQALSYYTQLLNRPTGKKPPEKGTRLWNHEDTSV